MKNDILQTVNKSLKRNETSVDRYITAICVEISQLVGCLSRTDNFTLKVGVFRHELAADIRSVDNIYAADSIFEKVGYQQITRLRSQSAFDDVIRWSVRGRQLYIAPVCATPLNIELDVTYYHPESCNPILLPDRCRAALEHGVIAAVAADYKMTDLVAMHTAIYKEKLNTLAADFDHDTDEDTRFKSIQDRAAALTNVSDMAAANSLATGQSRDTTGSIKYNDL